MDDKQAITFTRWGVDLGETLKPALPGDSFAYVRREVKRGYAGVAWLGNMAVVLRIEGLELVVVAAAGEGLLPATKRIYQFARKRGLSSIRFHTRRKGLFRHVKVWPFVLAETRGDEKIYRMTVKG